MNKQGNQRIHELLGNCWHEWEYHENYHTRWHRCKKCGWDEIGGISIPKSGPDYGSKELPDSLRVAMVTAAYEVFGADAVMDEVAKNAPERELYGWLTRCLSIPAPQIAEAIDRLIVEEGE